MQILTKLTTSHQEAFFALHKKESIVLPTRKSSLPVRNQAQYHLMLMPGMLLLFVFSILPMAGIVIAFQRFVPAKGVSGSAWVGLLNFRYMFTLPDSLRIFRNTLSIAVMKIVFRMIVPIIFALLMNELRSVRYKRIVQTSVYLPHFMSWVVLATPIFNIFSYQGAVNQLIALLGGERILFMSNSAYFRSILVLTDTWKEFGFGTIVYMAAITGIDPTLYEAAKIDGASRFQEVIHIVLPGMMSVIVLMATRSLGNVLNAGFEQIYNLYSPAVYEVADIVDTYVYRVGLLEKNYSLSTAVGLLKSVISMVLILTSYKLAKRLAGYSIF